MRVAERLLYLGPNRRSRHTAIEWLLQAEPGEAALLQSGLAAALVPLGRRLDQGGAGDVAAWLRGWPGPGSTPLPPFPNACQLLGDLAVRLQRSTGHVVNFTAVLPGPDAEQCRLIFEYEHADTGADAGEIAARLLAESLPGLAWEPDDDVPGENAVDALRRYRERASGFVLPGDAQAIIDAAARLDVPCVKLERPPYQGVSGEFRIRPNGLLKLGHACHLRIVDGTLCLDRSASLVPLLFDRERLAARMRDLGLPLSQSAPGPLTATRRVIRAAEALGFPVVLKPVSRRPSAVRRYDRALPPLRDERELTEALEGVRRFSPQVRLERHVAGQTWHVLVAGGETVCAVHATDGPKAPPAVHESIRRLAEAVATQLDCGLLALTVVTPDAARPLGAVGGAVVGLDPAPQLDRLLPAGPPWLDRAAGLFVRWLYPEGAPARIPLVAVTGTNGKTTTSMILARIAKTAGRVPGLASTSGVFIDERLTAAGDLAGVGGHHLLFESRVIDFGVLETARGGVASAGFMFDHCDVGVCLNVSEDHIGEYGIESVTDMVTVKRSILERATGGVVINADYDTCLSMLPFRQGVRTWLCSLTRDAQDVLRQAGPGGAACVLERDGAGGAGEEWLVCYENGRRLPVLPVAAFPATLGGAARFNVSNAQHAVAAARLMGFEVAVIARALRGFDASFETNPGRLNVYRGHPFTVVMDYAHNPDGMRQLFDCLDRLGLDGRRILLFATSGNRTDAEVVRNTRYPVGRVDHYVVRRYPGNLRGRRPDEIPVLMQETLLAAGVPADRITMSDPPEQGALFALRLAQPGDVVILSPGTGEFEAMWRQVLEFEPEVPAGR